MRPAYPGSEGAGFRCDLCGATFPDASGLRRHLLTEHVATSGARCVVCGRSFASRAELELHVRSEHPGRRD